MLRPCFVFSSPLINTLVPAAIPNVPFHLHFKSGSGDEEQDIVNYKFSSHDIVSLICCSIFGGWYLWKKVRAATVESIYTILC